MSSYLVTGTDTDVGKTVASAWLASALAPNHRLALIKPAQTGSTNPAVDGDEAFYRQHLAGLDLTIETWATLPEPLAPSIAADRAGQPIDTDDLVARARTTVTKHDITLLEGAGGLLVTLRDGYDYADFARDTASALVVVIRPALGTLNHTLLTLEAAEGRGLPVEMLVCSGFPTNPGLVEEENVRFLAARLPDMPLVVLGRADFDAGDTLNDLNPRLIGPHPPLLDGVELPPYFA